MSNESQEVTFFSRLKQKWFLILLGSVICCFVGYTLCRNEQLSKAQNVMASTVLQKVISVSSESIESQNEGQVIYATGNVRANQFPKDDMLGVEAHGVALKRNVKMYQLFERVEEKQQRKIGPRKIGDEQGDYETIRSYRYEGEWREELINSDDFHNTSWTNPKEFPYPQTVFVGGDVMLGTFKLSDDHLTNSDNFQTYELEASVIDGLQDRLGRNVSFEEKSNRFPARIYIGFGTRDNPRVGDVLVSYEWLPLGEYSALGQQSSDKIVPYENDGISMALLGSGIKTTEDLMASEQFAGNFMSWFFRGLAMLFLCGGYALVFRPFSSVNTGVMSTVMRPGTFVVALTAAFLTIGLIIQFA